ncbi:MAG: acyl-CoA dehydrogenase family protein, partial [Peptococcaceae bacterium]|nr:acyl-CoA dehydrogenase family protein [Peptococcaceae bacterium]
MASNLPDTFFTESRIAPKKSTRVTLTDFLDHVLPESGKLAENDPGFRREFYKEMGNHGIMGMAGPRPYGSSFSLRQMATVFEAVAKSSVGLAISLAAHTLCVYMIGRWGTESQKKRWLPGLCRGEKLGAFCLTETKAGSDARSLILKAVPSPEGYTLKGTKTFVTNGNEASLYAVMARINRPDAENNGPIGVFIVDRADPKI